MKVLQDGDTLKVALSEKFTIYEVEKFRDEVLQNLSENIKTVELNGEKVETVDTLGVQIMFSLLKSLKSMNIESILLFSTALRDKYTFFGFNKGV
jgi:anti-anti-sigma regulatory factor